MKKRFLVFIIFLAMICTIFTVTRAASGLNFSTTATYDDTSGAWTLNSGSYTVSGTAEKNEYIKIDGDVTLTLNNCTIEKDSDLDKYAPAISIESGNVNLILNGTNTLKGDIGYAAIYVAEGASLTISGSGTLNAQGGAGRAIGTLPAMMQSGSNTNGYCGGGAGIGGNGLWVYTNKTWIADTTQNFGTITIESGNITATGGKSNYLNAGAGAGIGSGGSTYQNPEGKDVEGTIEINNGTINATGGDGENLSLTLGGAGIGSGGVGRK